MAKRLIGSCMSIGLKMLMILKQTLVYVSQYPIYTLKTYVPCFVLDLGYGLANNGDKLCSLYSFSLLREKNVIFLITKHFVIMKLGFELEISPLPECPVFINSEHSTN